MWIPDRYSGDTTQGSTCGDIRLSVQPRQWMKPRGWVIGIADTGRMFVLNKDTGRVVKEAFLGLPGWNVFDPHPDSGYWLPGPSGIAISPDDGLLYVAGTDYDRAWINSRYQWEGKALLLRLCNRSQYPDPQVGVPVLHG